MAPSTYVKHIPYKPYDRFTTLIFDLGDVLFTWSASSVSSSLPPETFKRILRSSTWFDYEKGNITEDEVYTQISHQLQISASDVANSVRAARSSLTCNIDLLEVIREIKGSGRKVFAMSNISAPDWKALATRPDAADWAVFDRVFTSAEAGERKPNVGFYQHVLEVTGVDPTRTIFVDDKLENVVTARSLGMHGILFEDTNRVVGQLKGLCGDPIQKGKSFLATNKRRFFSSSSNGHIIRENFAQLLILEATGDSSMVDYDEYPRLFNFFRGSGILTTEIFPNDLDTTSIGLTVSDYVNPETKEDVMDEMLSFCNEDGIVQVYFDHSRPRIDPVVCANVLTLFYRNGRGHQLALTLDWVYLCLLHRAYIDGTLYYSTAEAFLFFVSRLIRSSEEVRRRFEPVFKDRILERFGVDGDPLSLSMRLIAATTVGLVHLPDLNKLLAMQNADGSWADGWFYKFGSSGIMVKNDGLTTALAISAIEATLKWERLIRSDSGRLSEYIPVRL